MQKLQQTFNDWVVDISAGTSTQQTEVNKKKHLNVFYRSGLKF